jgi:hypothetical protein
MFDGIDWEAVGRPTPAQRRETAEVQAEAAPRGHEANLIGAIVDGQGYLKGRYLWD